MAAHADTHDRDLGHVLVDLGGLEPDLRLVGPHDLHGARGVALAHREAHVRDVAGAGARLHDHVDVDVGVGQPLEDHPTDARVVGQAEQGDLGLVAAVGHARDDALLHDGLLVADDGADVVRRSRQIFRFGEGRQHAHGHALRHGQLHRARLQHLGAERGHLQHLLVGDARDAAGAALDARVGGVDAVHVRVDVAALGLERGGDGHRRGVRPAAAERGDAAVGGDALEAREHGDLPPVHGLGQRLGGHVLDARAAVGGVAQDGGLPAEPGARVQSHGAQRHGQEPGGDLLAGGDHHVVLVVGGRQAGSGGADGVGPADQLVGLAAHGADHHGHAAAGARLRGHQPAHAGDALQVGHGGAAELHDEAGGHDRAQALATAALPSQPRRARAAP